MKKLLAATLIATTMLTTACTRVTDAETGIRQTFSGEIVDVNKVYDNAEEFLETIKKELIN